VERLQKVLARRGVASRRKSEEYIAAGRVAVNGEIVRELGTKVDPDKDLITVDGQATAKAQLVYLAFHKPLYCITSKSDPQGRPTIMDFLPPAYQELHPVGRLDWNTEGLLLLTNDGELTFKITHPSYEIEKTYLVWTETGVGKKELEKLAGGINLEDGPTSPGRARLIEPGLIELTIHEGRNRQVRRMMGSLNLPVKRLQRISLGPIELKDLSPGKFRKLTQKEINNLKKGSSS